MLGRGNALQRTNMDAAVHDVLTRSVWGLDRKFAGKINVFYKFSEAFLATSFNVHQVSFT